MAKHCQFTWPFIEIKRYFIMPRQNSNTKRYLKSSVLHTKQSWQASHDFFSSWNPFFLFFSIDCLVVHYSWHTFQMHRKIVEYNVLPAKKNWFLLLQWTLMHFNEILSGDNWLFVWSRVLLFYINCKKGSNQL